MTCENGEASGNGGELMDVEIADASNGCITEIRENGLLLWPVMPQEEGEGLPYAPVNWPNHGDIWGWRVGKRVANSGYYLDRYLYLPLRFQKSKRKKDGFASKLSAAQYVRARFPDADVDAFFASFSWRIPSKQAYLLKDERGSFSITSEEMGEQSPSVLLPSVGCKAGNILCPSLSDQTTPPPKPVMICDICCTEPNFCGECSCILCNRSIDTRFGGYSFFRCEATLDDQICNHVAHIECALRCYLAGTVGGTIKLDTEYHCRRCDCRTDLTKHITNVLKICETADSRETLEKMLTVGICLSRGSKKKDTQKLLAEFEAIHEKFKLGLDVKDIWQGQGQGQVESVPVSPGQKDPNNPSSADKLLKECGDLEAEVNEVLEKLKNAQRIEFKMAKEKLYAQKDVITSHLKQLEREQKELDGPKLSPDRFALLKSITNREALIKRELRKLREIEKVANGLGKTPKEVIKEHFVDDGFGSNQ